MKNEHQNKSHMIFLVYGASGSGKSTILQMANSLSDRVSIHKKDTTRKERPLEKGRELPELGFKDKLNPDDYVYIYKQYDKHYGIRKDQMSQAFVDHKIHFIIIGDMKAIKEVKKLYPYAVTLYIHYSPEEIPKRFLDRDPLEYEKRKAVIEKQYTGYIENSTFFNHVILNLWSLDNARTQLGHIIQQYDPTFEFDEKAK